MIKQFATAIANAAAHNDYNIPDKLPEDTGADGKPVLNGREMRKVKKQYDADDAASRRKIKDEYGFAVGGGRAFFYKPKPQWQYDLWKEIIPFLLNGMFLDLKPKQLSEKFSETGRDITARMISDPIKGSIALSGLKALIKDCEKGITLKNPVSIRSVQKELISLRDAIGGVETFNLSGEIKGDSAYVSGRPYKIQRDRHGHRRIRYGSRWFYLDPIIEK